MGTRNDIVLVLGEPAPPTEELAHCDACGALTPARHVLDRPDLCTDCIMDMIAALERTRKSAK